MSYTEFFQKTTKNEPFLFQRRLGEDPWPVLLEIPTGMGKTAGVITFVQNLIAVCFTEGDCLCP